VEERIDLMVHLDVHFIIVFLELDGFHSIVDLSDQKAEFILGGLLFIMI